MFPLYLSPFCIDLYVYLLPDLCFSILVSLALLILVLLYCFQSEYSHSGYSVKKCTSFVICLVKSRIPGRAQSYRLLVFNLRYRIRK